MSAAGSPSDEELMRTWAAGDAAAFQRLFERYAPLLLRVMQRQLRDREEAHDLVQQTFLQLCRSRGDFDAEARLRPWLLTIALNLKREHFRRVKRRPEAPLTLDGRSDPAVGALGAAQVDARRDLGPALAALPEEQREVIELHWFEGLTFPEVAAIVGATPTAVKVRAHRGYVALRAALGHAPAAPAPGQPAEATAGPLGGPGSPGAEAAAPTSLGAGNPTTPAGIPGDEP